MSISITDLVGDAFAGDTRYERFNLLISKH